MAGYSPSPTSVAGTNSMHPGRRSPSPPALPISKRDKKRNQHIQLQQDLIEDFTLNRDPHYKAQLIALQYDMSLITQADPYNPEPMEDSPDEIARAVEEAAAGTPYQADMSKMAGRWYSEFVHEVNEAKEAKEIELTQLRSDHQARLARLKYECDYRLHLAAEECEQLTSTLRERLVQSLSHKKQRLVKEKEHLDIADTNTLLLHPSQFSITNPSSPGGPQNGGRKTRYTRHRVDPDELANGLAPDGTNKRKRKMVEDDQRSPSRDGISTPAERAKAKITAHQTAPLYSINALFTDKELTFQTHQAHIATRHFFSISRREGNANGTRKRSRDSDAENTADSGEDSAQDEDGALEAPEMDRAASQTFHVTRSTRNTGAMAGLNILSDLAEKAVTRPVLPYATLYSHQPKTGTFLPSPSRLMPEEMDEDYTRVNDALSQPPGYVDQKAMEEAQRPISETRSTLAPDWPLYLDVHLVDVNKPVSFARG